jgi:hypothetical protein
LLTSELSAIAPKTTEKTLLAGVMTPGCQLWKGPPHRRAFQDTRQRGRAKDQERRGAVVGFRDGTTPTRQTDAQCTPPDKQSASLLKQSAGPSANRQPAAGVMSRSHSHHQDSATATSNNAKPIAATTVNSVSFDKPNWAQLFCHVFTAHHRPGTNSTSDSPLPSGTRAAKSKRRRASTGRSLAAEPDWRTNSPSRHAGETGKRVGVGPIVRESAQASSCCTLRLRLTGRRRRSNEGPSQSSDARPRGQSSDGSDSPFLPISSRSL